ncbi:MAG: hypothetical protein MUF87_16960, partial [Anaerolineae bacterium]|nr:hypothetical protein [Anaerolineae bacterium]
NGGRIGAIGDARVIPHPVTWSPTQAVLVVETRNGAIYWNVITGVQVTLTTAWDSWQGRNLRGISWGNDQFLIQTVTGEYFRFTLAEGQPTTASNTASSANPATARCSENQITSSEGGWSYYENFYDRETRQLRYGSMVLETDLETPEIRVYGAFNRCRYLLTAIQRIGSPKIYDTVIYDLSTGTRAGIFEDARLIPHYFTVDPRGEHLILETRDAGYLWHVPSDTKTLLVDESRVLGNYYRRFVRNFHQIHWDTEGGQILTVSVKNPFGVTVFDYNGQEVGYYLSESLYPIQFQLMMDGRWLLAHTEYNYSRSYAPLKISLWNRMNGTTVHLDPRIRVNRTQFILNPSERYLLLITPDRRYWQQSYFRVWDLDNLNADGSANVVNLAQNYTLSYWSSPSEFVGETILQDDERQWEILTGQLLFTPQTYALQPAAAAIAQTSGYSNYQPCWNEDRQFHHANRQIVVRHRRTGEILHVLMDNDENLVENYTNTGNCRFMAISIGTMSPRRYRFYPQRTRLWDLDTYSEIPLPFDRLLFLSWSPDQDRALVQTIYRGDSQLQIWMPATGTFTPIDLSNLNYYTHTPKTVYWDYQRGQIVLLIGYNAYSYDLNTGASRYYFGGGTAFINYEPRTGSDMYITGDWLFIRGNETLTFYHLDTLQNDQVWVGVRPITPQTIAIGPEGRYLVIASPTRLYVWDLMALPVGVRDRLPTVSDHGLNYEQLHLRFSDATTLELETQRGVIRRYQLPNGQAIE